MAGRGPCQSGAGGEAELIAAQHGIQSSGSAADLLCFLSASLEYLAHQPFYCCLTTYGTSFAVSWSFPDASHVAS